MERPQRQGKKQNIRLTAEGDCALLPFLREKLSGRFGSGKIKSLLEHRAVTVKGAVCTAFDHPLAAGDPVEICLERHTGIPLDIIYEDGFLMAVDKPAGLLTVATDSEKELTAYRILKDSLKRDLFVVHRLDRETSGVLLFAKSREIRDNLQDNWQSAVSSRNYTAICEGIFEKKSGRIESSLAQNGSFIVRSVRSGGKNAVTEYSVGGESKGYSLVSVSILTGRKNQIRVHMSEQGHPIAGDKKYGAKTDPIRRLALHAGELEFRHPVTGETVRIVSRCPFSLKNIGGKKK